MGVKTGAKNELYISYPRVATRAGPGGMMLTPSRFLQELPDDLYEELRIKRSYGWEDDPRRSLGEGGRIKRNNGW